MHFTKFAEGQYPYTFQAWEIEKPYHCKACGKNFKNETNVYNHCRREVGKERAEEEKRGY